MPLEAEAIAVMTTAFRQMEAMVTAPTKVPHGRSFVFRYANKGIREAILQKLARSISGLNAVSVLLRAGFVQEVGVLFRTLDEIQEDIIFLATAETNDARTDRHERYLQAFYSDPVFSRPEGSLEIPKPDLVPRKKIRAHTMNVLGEGVDASKALAAFEAVGLRTLATYTRRLSRSWRYLEATRLASISMACAVLHASKPLLARQGTTSTVD